MYISLIRQKFAIAMISLIEKIEIGKIENYYGILD